MFFSAKEIIDNKMAEIGKRLNSDASSTADMSFLEYMLANKDFSEEEIYTNMTELLLSGVDTVCVTYLLTHLTDIKTVCK